MDNEATAGRDERSMVIDLVMEHSLVARLMPKMVSSKILFTKLVLVKSRTTDCFRAGTKPELLSVMRFQAIRG